MEERIHDQDIGDELPRMVLASDHEHWLLMEVVLQLIFHGGLPQVLTDVLLLLLGLIEVFLHDEFSSVQSDQLHLSFFFGLPDAGEGNDLGELGEEAVDQSILVRWEQSWVSPSSIE